MSLFSYELTWVLVSGLLLVLVSLGMAAAYLGSPQLHETLDPNDRYAAGSGLLPLNSGVG